MEEVNKETILITGGTGYIGSHTVRHFLEKGWRVLILDNFSKGYREVVDILSSFGDLALYEGDLLDIDSLEKIFATEKITGVVHLAAPCQVNESMERPHHYFSHNVQGTINLLEVMKNNDVRQLVFSSTCAVYGQIDKLPINETQVPDPQSVYGSVKLEAENAIKWYGQIYDLNYVIFRFFNASGASSDGLIGDSKKPSSLLIPNAIRGAMNIEDFYLTYQDVDTPDGSPIRDFVDVEDLAEAIHHAFNVYFKNGGQSDIFHVGSGSGYSVKEIIKTVEDCLSVKLATSKAITPRRGEIPAIYSDTEKLETVFGWKPKKSLEDSVKSLVKWYNNKPNGYDY